LKNSEKNFRLKVLKPTPEITGSLFMGQKTTVTGRVVVRKF
jgi:hypothetical protein